jgi:hypothetical protein
MEDQNGSGTVVEMAASKRRKRPARRAGAASGARKPRKTSGARPRPAARRKAASSTPSLEGIIKSITGGVAIARAAIAEASEGGAGAVRRVAGSASKASRRTVSRLAGEWRSMDPRKKAGLLATLLGTAAAASVPLVRKSLKK